MTDETYQGWKNHETWAFNLHWSNDQGLYHAVLETGRTYLADNSEASDYELGKVVIEFAQALWEESPENNILTMWRNEVGSVWRVDEDETGASVRESLDV